MGIPFISKPNDVFIKKDQLLDQERLLRWLTRNKWTNELICYKLYDFVSTSVMSPVKDLG